MFALKISLTDKTEIPGFVPMYRDHLSKIEYEESNKGITIASTMGAEKTPIRVFLPWTQIASIVWSIEKK